MHLQVVEDDRQLADVARRSLERDGHHIEMCADGDDAVRQIGVREFDAVAHDVTLADRSGLEVRGQRVRGYGQY